MRRRWVIGAICSALVLLGAYQTGVWVQAVPTGEYQRVTLNAIDENGTTLATVQARVANTSTQRLVGLSRTDSLAADEGMLFVYDEPASHAFVMRNMDFPLDIVFIAPDGTVTEIHHASTPDGLGLEAGLAQHVGTGQYVLEVNRGWANRTGVAPGDRITVGVAEPVDSGDGGPGSGTPTESGRPTVTTLDRNGTTLANVSVQIAATADERYTGLSDTASLGPDEGMLFVHPREETQAYVMREMDFPLDIVFVAANGTVTRIHHAPLPPEDAESLRRYRGTAKYVLEVNRGWTNRTGLDRGDRVALPPAVDSGE